MKEERSESASAVSHADTMNRYRMLICSACDFYKPGDDLECAAYKVIVYFIENGRLSPEEVELAVSKACRQSVAQEIRK